MGEYNDIQNALYCQLLTLQRRSSDISSVPELLEVTEAMLDLATMIQDLDKENPDSTTQGATNLRLYSPPRWDHIADYVLDGHPPTNNDIVSDKDIPVSAIRFANVVRGHIEYPAYYRGKYCGTVYVRKDGGIPTYMTVRSKQMINDLLQDGRDFKVPGLPHEARP